MEIDWNWTVRQHGYHQILVFWYHFVWEFFQPQRYHLAFQDLESLVIKQLELHWWWRDSRKLIKKHQWMWTQSKKKKKSKIKKRKISLIDWINWFLNWDDQVLFESLLFSAHCELLGLTYQFFYKRCNYTSKSCGDWAWSDSSLS